jgi:hypothetical protein
VGVSGESVIDDPALERIGWIVKRAVLDQVLADWTRGRGVERQRNQQNQGEKDSHGVIGMV